MKSTEIGKLHVDQFNALFDSNILDAVVYNTEPQLINDISLSFEKLEVHKPFNLEQLVDNRAFPYEAREASDTYGGNMYVKIKVMHKDQVILEEFRPAGKFPVMLKSSLCHLTEMTDQELYRVREDPQENGGYFIVGGHDKLVRFHIAFKRNFFFGVHDKPRDASLSGFSCFIRCVGDDEIGHKNEIALSTDGNILYRVFINAKSYFVPVIYILRALKSVTDREIYERLHCVPQALQFLMQSAQVATYSRKETTEYLGSRFKHVFRQKDAEAAGIEFLSRVLSHVDTHDDKFELLIYAINKLFKLSTGAIEPDNIDIQSNHELYSEAQLIPVVIKDRLEEIKRIFRIKVLSFIKREITKKQNTGDTRDINNNNLDNTSNNLDNTSNNPDINTDNTRDSNLDNTTTVNDNLTTVDNLDFSFDSVSDILDILKKVDFDIGSKISKFLSTGSLTHFNCSDLLQSSGFTIMAERINYWRFAAHFHSVARGSFFASLKITSIRKLRPEGFGFFCPINTPDGSPCGLLTHLTKYCELTHEKGVFDERVLYDMGVISREIFTNISDNISNNISKNISNNISGNISQNISDNFTPVFYNGRILGYSDSPSSLATSLRSYRNTHSLKIEVVHEYGERIEEIVAIYDDMGGLMREVWNKKKNKREWIGIKEQAFLNISLSDKHGDINRDVIRDPIINRDPINRDPINSRDPCSISDTFGYVEISTDRMFSTIASCISFGDHNPSPRNMYQCQMAKQAMGIPAMNMFSRTDNKSYVVNYLQDPVVKTEGADTFARFPLGYNCVVAVLSYTAYDMEDAVILNKASVERGMFHGYVIKNEKIVLEREDRILQTPEIGAVVECGDTLCTYKTDGIVKHIKYEGTERGTIERVRIFSKNSRGVSNTRISNTRTSTHATSMIPCVTVTLRILRNPVIGDKFCSRHGQKGVCSFLWPEADMPFTEDGIKPDIIINPHAFPSRMTIGMLIESICGKGAVHKGETVNSSMFQRSNTGGDTTDNINNNNRDNTTSCINKFNMADVLSSCGFNHLGNEPMYSGVLGTELKTDIFIGVVYYQRLRHMVSDKFQVRVNGAVVGTTHQPVKGRKNKGGIRFGEMERDALICHGTSSLLRDRLMNCSDKTEFTLCITCNSILYSNNNTCKCGGVEFRKVNMPYVFKYLLAELAAMNMRVEIE